MRLLELDHKAIEAPIESATDVLRRLLLVVCWVGVVDLQILLYTACVVLVLMRQWKTLVSKTTIRPKLDAATDLRLTIGGDEESEVWREVVL